jgi:hypothetical protein
VKEATYEYDVETGIDIELELYDFIVVDGVRSDSGATRRARADAHRAGSSTTTASRSGLVCAARRDEAAVPAVSRVTKPKRGRRGAKRLDLTSIREALRTGASGRRSASWSKPEDGDSHYEIVGDNADVMVEVELSADRIPVHRAPRGAACGWSPTSATRSR